MQLRVLEWQLDTHSKEILGPSGVERPRRQVYETFRLLLQRAPAVVSKEEILAAVWNGEHVSDSAIAQVIRELRALLGDDPSAPRLIATRHRQGYQCIAEVRTIDDEPPAAGLLAASPAAPRPRRLPWRLAMGAVVAMVTVLAGSAVWLALRLAHRRPPGG